jgi:hypothetical protein
MTVSNIDSLGALLKLDRQVFRARLVLQETSDLHPEFENRVQVLIELVERRDRALVSDDGGWLEVRR